MNGQQSTCDHHLPLPVLRAEPKHVHWRPTQSAKRFARRPHVIAWTCACWPIVYEKLMVGGSYLIRHTNQSDGSGAVPLESPPTRHEEADTLWRKILSGAAT